MFDYVQVSHRVNECGAMHTGESWGRSSLSGAVYNRLTRYRLVSVWTIRQFIWRRAISMEFEKKRPIFERSM